MLILLFTPSEGESEQIDKIKEIFAVARCSWILSLLQWFAWRCFVMGTLTKNRKQIMI